MSNRAQSYLRQNVLGLIALFIALGGTAYAANTIGSADVIDESLLSQDVKNGEVKVADIGQGAVATDELANGQVKSADIGAGEVRSGSVANDNLTGTDIAPNSLKGADIDESTLSSIGGGGPAGGDLTGTYPNPLIASHVVDGADVASDSLGAIHISGVEALRGSGLETVDDPVGGGPTNANLFIVGDFTVNAHCTDDGSGVVTAQVEVAYTGPTGYAATSDAPGGQTNTHTNGAVQLASLGPTTDPVLGSGTYTAVAPGAPLLGGVVAVGTHALATDCVFGINALG